MAKIYNYLKNGGGFENYEPYPVGMINAFKYYETYYPDFNEQHREYWNRVIKIYWNNHNEIHGEYNNDFSNFLDHFIRKYLF